ncbi:DeoR/GlpR family DNA-binding transcription regulator [Microbacterium mitrae]|uniref:DeoR/GlpR transcriptional regulator n=1 Tax=Microbacterium mitrae TaxID=664640 RepID=A0A5C8HN29_9MICO|nr:DeoR/GlpR family DNA-binding transcription regulator [Microbacterium mitrae]TXK03055.1 DeoR/GlpR transcriptional regulator [Microbacterium mitrae]
MKRAARLNTILDLLAAFGEVTVDDLVERFETSPATIRRDLDSLAEQRLLTRTHGGAVAQTVAYELPIRYKSHLRTHAKERIAAAAAARVLPGSVVGLSGGTTTTAIAAALAAREDLAERGGITVVTNAVNIAAQLATRPDIKVVVTGGVIHSRSYELVGPFVEQLLRGVHLDLAFIGVNGIDAAAGATTQDEREAAVNRIMAEQASRAFVVTDSTKLGSTAFAHVGGAELFAGVLTDADADDGVVAALRGAGYDVFIAE